MSDISYADTDKCPLKNLSELNYVDLECQFYLGTTAYRSKLYAVAAAHWQYIIDTEAQYEGEDEIKAMALGTINFLTYYGLGLKQDRDKAIVAWKKAAKNGSLEARRHLGYAYSDREYKKNDLVKSLAWYKTIFILHPNPDELGESDSTVYKDALKESDEVIKKLSKKQIQDATLYAKKLLNL